MLDNIKTVAMWNPENIEFIINGGGSVNNLHKNFFRKMFNQSFFTQEKYKEQISFERILFNIK